MPRRNRNQLTGADYLLATASAAENDSVPFSDLFRQMVEASVLAPRATPLLAESIAERPLQECEAAPAAIVWAAMNAALRQGNDASAAEAVQLGVALLAKWPEYLIARQVHPRLERKRTDGTVT